MWIALFFLSALSVTIYAPGHAFSPKNKCVFKYHKTTFQQGLVLNDVWILYMVSPFALGSSLVRQAL